MDLLECLPLFPKGSVPLPFQGAGDDGALRVLSEGPGPSCDQQELEAPLPGRGTQGSAQLLLSQRGAL